MSKTRTVVASLAASVAMLASSVPAAYSDPEVDTAAGPEGYRNPVHGQDAGFADPSVIRGRDGSWYAFGTGRGIRIARSADLVTWEPVGHVITDDNRPSWVGPNSGTWAPDIAYVGGRYVLTFTVAGTPVAPTPNRAVGVATAPTPAGPWTLPDSLLLEPEWWYPTPNAPRDFRSIMDSDLVTGPDGTRYLYYGGFRGGIYVVELSADGTRVVGDPVKVAAEHSFEAAHVVYRDGWFYLMVSSGGCCAGPVSGYQVLASRSRSPWGPFVDKQGVPMLGRTPGGTPVVSATGNRWVGPGHHTIVTDLAGQDWFVYHAIDRTDPYADPPSTETIRPMLVDRLDWVDGWPVLRGGLGASDETLPAPAAVAPVADAFESGEEIGRSWRSGSGWSVSHDEAGGHARSPAGAGESVLSSRRVVNGDVRLRAVLRLADDVPGAGAGGLGLDSADGRSGVRVLVDRRSLAVEGRVGGGWATIARRALPASFDATDWHELDIRLRGRSLRATVTDAGQYDPVADVSVDLPANDLPAKPPPSRVQAIARGAVVDVDDVTAAPLTEPHDRMAPDPQPGDVDADLSDEFTGELGPAWRWIRQPAAEITDGHLRFPVQDADLTGDSDSASLLVVDAPDGEWIAETAVTADFGEPDRYPQAGLVAYVNDDCYVRLAVRGHGFPVLTAFQKEMPYGDRTVANSATFGAGEPTTGCGCTTASIRRPVSTSFAREAAGTDEPGSGRRPTRCPPGPISRWGSSPTVASRSSWTSTTSGSTDAPRECSGTRPCR